MINDTSGALRSVDEYFNGIYMAQIAANGDQVVMYVSDGKVAVSDPFKAFRIRAHQTIPLSRLQLGCYDCKYNSLLGIDQGVASLTTLLAQDQRSFS